MDRKRPPSGEKYADDESTPRPKRTCSGETSSQDDGSTPIISDVSVCVQTSSSDDSSSTSDAASSLASSPCINDNSGTVVEDSDSAFSVLSAPCSPIVPFYSSSSDGSIHSFSYAASDSLLPGSFTSSYTSDDEDGMNSLIRVVSRPLFVIEPGQTAYSFCASGSPYFPSGPAYDSVRKMCAFLTAARCGYRDRAVWKDMNNTFPGLGLYGPTEVMSTDALLAIVNTVNFSGALTSSVLELLLRNCGPRVVYRLLVHYNVTAIFTVQHHPSESRSVGREKGICPACWAAGRSRTLFHWIIDSADRMFCCSKALYALLFEARIEADREDDAANELPRTCCSLFRFARLAAFASSSLQCGTEARQPRFGLNPSAIEHLPSEMAFAFWSLVGQCSKLSAPIKLHGDSVAIMRCLHAIGRLLIGVDKTYSADISRSYLGVLPADMRRALLLQFVVAAQVAQSPLSWR